LLVEALPYIREFWGKIVVVKYGGNALAGPNLATGQAGAGGAGGGDPADARAAAEREALAAFAQDVVLVRSVGMLPVVIHGGGPQIGDLMRRLGKEVAFHDGLRVTDAETLDIARMVLVGKVNRDIVSAVNVHGPLAVGLSGEDARLITATPRSAHLGYVGDVLEVDPVMLQRLLAQGLIPVVATIGADRDGQAYNINADSVAGAVAAALGAERLVFLTDVEGLRSRADEPRSLMPQVTVGQLEDMVTSGTVSGGMIPKVQACVHAVRGGVTHAHILDGRVPHSLLLELFTDSGIGTMISP